MSPSCISFKEISSYFRILALVFQQEALQRREPKDQLFDH